VSHGRDPGPERIVLVGFMASGKTTVGRILARRLGWDLVDLDHLIRERTGATPGALIRERGEAAFRALETELTAELADRRRMILVPGGGWVTRPGNPGLLPAGSVRVWLRVSREEALRRVETDPADRPLLGPAEDRARRVDALMREREPLYAASELAVDVDDREPDAVAETILRRLGLAQEDDER
jgi:shikimate kinase